MSGKYALIIGNTEYPDPGLEQLTTPGKDADDFSRLRSDRENCGFEDVIVPCLFDEVDHEYRDRLGKSRICDGLVITE